MEKKELITKVLSGNASPLETKELNDWLAKSEENRRCFNQLQLMWHFVGSAKKETNPNVDTAWSKFVDKKEQLIQKPSKIIYKIAAVLIVILTSGAIGSYLLFNSQNKTLSTIAKVIVPKEKITTTNKLEVDVNLSEPEILKTRFKKHTKRKDSSSSFLEYVLVDSSTVKLNTNSALTFLDYSPNHSRVASLVGAGVFDIKPSSQLFILETDHIIIHVEGTKFNINDANNENPFVEIYVEEGSMDVFDKENLNNSISLTSGQKYLFDIQNRTFKQIKTNEHCSSGKWKKFWKKFKN